MAHTQSRWSEAAAAHRGYTVYAVAMFFVYPIGTPLVFYLFLRREEHVLKRISRHEYSAQALRQLEKKRTAEKKGGRPEQDTHMSHAPSFELVAQGSDAPARSVLSVNRVALRRTLLGLLALRPTGVRASK